MRNTGGISGTDETTSLEEVAKRVRQVCSADPPSPFSQPGTRRLARRVLATAVAAQAPPEPWPGDSSQYRGRVPTVVDFMSCLHD